MKILVFEDDADAAARVVKALQEAGHLADLAAEGLEGCAQANEGDYDVLVVDHALPKLDGLSIIRLLRKQRVETPVLILWTRRQIGERVKGLRPGGGYRAKPLTFSELLARIEALARRQAGQESEQTVYRVGDLELDILSYTVTRAGKEIVLQPREFLLLEYLMRNAGQPVTRTMLLHAVWGYQFDPQTNVVDVQVSRLRAKIDKGYETVLIHTVRGTGYTIRDGAR